MQHNFMSRIIVVEEADETFKNWKYVYSAFRRISVGSTKHPRLEDSVSVVCEYS